MCMGVCLSVCLYTMCMLCVCRNQKGASDHLGLELTDFFFLNDELGRVQHVKCLAHIHEDDRTPNTGMSSSFKATF